MIFCSECFKDSEISSIIRTLEKRGKCPICGKVDSFLYDTEKNNQLSNIFNDLITIYTTANSLPNDFPKSDLRMLKDELQTNWHIFNEKLKSEHVYNILVSLSNDIYLDNFSLFDTPIGVSEKYDMDYLNQNSILRDNQWEDFVNAVKYDNRFHTNYINLDILRKFCNRIRKPYRKGTIFYRSRISSETGYTTKEMGTPQREFITDGRANSAGISRLYLANDIDTAIREVRAGAFDYVSIGSFRLLKDIIIVDLKMINKISPFDGQGDCLQYYVNKEHLNKINSEMGKTLRRSDSPLDYVPTQYLADFINSIAINDDDRMKYSGIEYKSTMNINGYNLAVFDPELFECMSVMTYKIDELSYKTSEM